MAWRSSGTSNATLINNLVRNGLITSDRVKSAMMKVDRSYYAPRLPYEDSPQSIGYSATISAPHMHAAACESLLPYLNAGSSVLDVGSGSGYLTHVLAELVSPGGRVVGVDHIQPLVDMSLRNAQKGDDGRRLMEAGSMQLVKGDGRLGWEAAAPYDAIHVGAAASEVHEQLIDQLKAPGRIFIPVEEAGQQYIYVVDKDEHGIVTKKKEFGVRYVPLTDAPNE